MKYQISKQSGDTLSVPMLLIHNLQRADAEAVKVALYIISSGSTEPRDIAHNLNISDIKKVQKHLAWWHGAGLLDTVSGPAVTPPVPSQPLRQSEINLVSLRDPNIAMLQQEVQRLFGTTMGHSESSKLTALYLTEGYDPEVILLCAARIATGTERRTISKLQRNLATWRGEGVETAKQAEAYLQKMDIRADHETKIAELFEMRPEELTAYDKRIIAAWYEKYHFDDALIAEAALQAQEHRDIRYVNGILKAWDERGLHTVQQVRGGGTLSNNESSALRVDRNTPSGNDIIMKRRLGGPRLKRKE